MKHSTTRIIPPNLVLIETLNGLLSHEIAAVEIYNLCIDGHPTHHATTIAFCRDSHLNRCTLLRQSIVTLGGGPTQSADFWGRVTAIIMADAVVAGTPAMLSILDQGEEDTLATYQVAIVDLDAPTGAFLREQCIPAQMQTFTAIRELREQPTPPKG
jgi:hypothetical protein